MDSRRKRRESGDENARSYNLRKTVKRHSEGKSKLPGQPNSTAMVEAERIRSNLPPGSFSFTFTKKLRTRNITDSSTRLCIPCDFVNRHLSNVEKNTIMKLENEKNKVFDVTYLPGFPGFGGGWSSFVHVHKLGENDVLLFLLTEPWKFKVFISRAPCHVDAKPTNMVSDSSDATSEENEQGDLSDNPNTDLSQDLETYKAFQLKIRYLFSQPGINEDTVRKYYNLCRCKNEILHDQILSDFNINLVAGIITQLLYIVDGFKASNVSTSTETLKKWQVALESFEKLGMKVGFVVKKVNDLIRLLSEETRYKDDLKKLEINQVELTEACIKVSGDIAELKSKAEAHKDKVQEVINSPW